MASHNEIARRRRRYIIAEIRREEAKVASRWNAANPVGSAVMLTIEDGSVVTAVTRSPAKVMGMHATVWVVGYVRGHLLSCVEEVSAT